MRNLTIKRAKRYVASLTRMKVYIEDPEANELTINGTPCRKLGDLKNGEEATFPIGEGAAKVFVIADKMSRGFCSDFYQIAEGSEDIRLTGQNELNLGTGNAFRFDNNPDAPDEEQKKMSRNRGILTIVLSVALGIAAYLIVGALMRAGNAPKPKTFTKDGMTVTLTDEFAEMQRDGYSAVYSSKDVAVFALKEEFSLGEGFEDLALNEYVDLVISGNSFNNVEKKDYDGTPGFEYSFTNPDTKDAYRYFSYAYKTGDAFWLIQYATLEKNAEKFAPQIAEWAKTVKFGAE